MTKIRYQAHLTKDEVPKKRLKNIYKIKESLFKHLIKFIEKRKNIYKAKRLNRFSFTNVKNSRGNGTRKKKPAKIRINILITKYLSTTSKIPDLGTSRSVFIYPEPNLQTSMCDKIPNPPNIQTNNQTDTQEKTLFY